MMKKTTAAAAAAAFLVLPAVPAAAEGLTFGATIVSDYVSDAVTQTDGNPALQLFAEYESVYGIYGGIWMSNVDFGGPDEVEIDLSFGYRHDFGPFSVDLGYFAYYYNDTGFDSDETVLAIGYPITEALGMSTSITWDFDDSFQINQAFVLALPHTFELSGEVEYDFDSDDTNWNLGVTKALTDNFSVDLRYHDANYADPRITLALAFTGDLSLFRK